jgi:hypothetical protein
MLAPDFGSAQGQAVQAATAVLIRSECTSRCCQLGEGPSWALALSPMLGSRAGPLRGWPEPLPGLIRPGSPAPVADGLIRGGEFGCQQPPLAPLGGSFMQAEGGTPTRASMPCHRLSIASIIEARASSPLQCWRCRLWALEGDGSGANQRQSEPLRRSAGNGCCHVKRLDGAPSTTTKQPKPVLTLSAADWRGGLHTSEMRWTEKRQRRAGEPCREALANSRLDGCRRVWLDVGLR